MWSNRSRRRGDVLSDPSQAPDGEVVTAAPDEAPPLWLLLAGLSLERELTARECEVVVAAIRGLDTKTTAGELGVSPKTVDEMWRRVYRKFRCRSRVEVLSRLLGSCFRLLLVARGGSRTRK
jgi:DNA-binding NarL/FixJ family response regulator